MGYDGKNLRELLAPEENGQSDECLDEFNG